LVIERGINMNLKKEFHRIEKIFHYLKLDEIEEIGVMTFLNKDSIFVKCAKENYIVNVRELKNIDKNYFKNKMTKIKTLEYFNDNGIPAVFPIKFNDKYFINYRNREYEIYKYVNYHHFKNEELNDKKIKKLANVQAIMHNLNVKLALPPAYSEIKLNLDKHLKKIEKYAKEGYKILYEYVYQIDEIVKNYNNNYKYALNNLILGYNNYDLNNIEWLKDYMYLVDYTNCCLINPSVSLAESAYFISYQDKKIDYERYELYLKTYIKKYGPLSFDYKEALYVSMYKLLKKLEELINRTIKEKEDTSKEIAEVVKELLIHNANIERLYATYIDSVKK